ncbi:MAG: division/cell wall cluster transcriptional repressor MraZ [Candidatus Zixiibacteriota bacterium]
MGDAFTGTYRFQRDHRGRMVIPKKMRVRDDGMAYAKFVITIGPDRSLTIFPIPTFKKFLARHRKSKISAREAVAFNRAIYPNTEEVEVDTHGRILLPQEICAKVGIEKEVIIIGSGDWIEVWDPERYDKYQQKLFEHSQDALMNFYGGGGFENDDDDDNDPEKIDV